MGKTLFTSQGAPVDIGRELGRGGEGSVVEVPSLRDQVAKLYHKEPDVKKQAKLNFMVAAADQQLLNYVAWPQETLHPVRGGPIVGFLMPKVAGKNPIHTVYSPAQRRQDYPKAAWDFLLFVARNVAASFETVHARGHVIGDVNQDSVMVGRDSKVVLIDSDSFQVNAKGNLHLCHVGVPQFTPPELQFLPSFDRVTRTTNHDNFGLALLIFHLLFGGRHPYSGVPLTSDVGDVLETDIKNFRYAYARDNQSRGILPPPRTAPVSMLPDAMESMFHFAFTERGAQGGRPTAKQWVASLDSVRGRLKRCSASTAHVYPDHLAKCPWCALEEQGVMYFVDIGTRVTPTSTGFSLERVWAMIEQVAVPPATSIPLPQTANVQAEPLPADIPRQSTIGFYKVVIAVLALVFSINWPNLWLLGLIGAVVGWGLAGTVGQEKRKAEREKRQAARDWAKREYEQLIIQIKQSGPDGFHARKRGLAALRSEYQNLFKSEKDELDQLQATAYTRQKDQFLRQCFIHDANIKDVGPGRKAVLRSFGIETAADVERANVSQVRGFGERLTNVMMDWRAACERRFTFNSANAVTGAERTKVRSKYAARKIAIEELLSGGVEELKRFSETADTRLNGLTPQVEWAAQKLAQAEKDLALL